MKKLCITFAGVVGSSKSPIANYLSGQLNLPVFNNDIIRTEVQEDIGRFNEEQYKKRRDERAEAILKSGASFIYDASVDREWLSLRQWLVQAEYECFIISLDLSKDLLIRLYEVKGYKESRQRLDQLLLEHQNFLNQHFTEIGVHITDEQFSDRLSIALSAAKHFMGSNS